MTAAATLCDRIVAARGGGIVRIVSAPMDAPTDAARLFGLSGEPGVYVEVPEDEARAVLVAVLVVDMAYGCPLVPAAEAAALAEAFVETFRDEGSSPMEYGRPRAHPDIGPSWTPATDHTFDTGVLVLSARRTGCAWFMDED